MTKTIVLPELVVDGKRLGRHIRHDPASLRYLIEETAEVVSVAWPRHIPILDQGNVGSCTGNALTGALGTGPLYDAITPLGLTLDERFALAVYSAAETLDGDGPYPPNDNGSSGLSVAFVAKTDGYISGYRHATSVAAAHAALQAGPFIIGSYWYSGMDTPTAEGIVHATGIVRGGHEYLCREYDATRDLWWLDNSWSASWGLTGRFAYDTATFTQLLANSGDVSALVPLTQPAPTPSPAPGPGADPADVAHAFEARIFISHKHSGENAAMARSTAAWLTAKGLN